MSPFIRPPTVGHSDRVLGRSVFLLLLGIYTATLAGLPGDFRSLPWGEADFQTTSALARTRRLALGGTPEADELIARARAAPPGTFAVSEGTDKRAGRFYAATGIGQAIVGLPFYAVGKLFALVLPGIEDANAVPDEFGRVRSEYLAHTAFGWRNALFTAWIAQLLVLCALRLGAGRLSAWIAGVSYGLASVAWPQALGALDTVTVCLALLFSFERCLRLREKFRRLSRPTPLGFTAIGLALGLALTTRIESLPAVLVLDVSALVVLHAGCAHLASWRASAGHRKVPGPWSSMLWILAPQVLLLGAQVALNRVRFGDYAPGFGARELAEAAADPVRLMGNLNTLLFAPGAGLFWLAPGVLLAVFGWVLRARRAGQRGVPYTMLSLTLCALAAASFGGRRHGPWTYGPGALAALLPFVWIGTAFALERSFTRRWLRVAVGVAFGLGLLVQIPAALVAPSTHRDLSLQAAHATWPEIQDGSSELSRVEARAERLSRAHWEWSFAAPWAHWRILRHRMAGLGEEFLARDLFGAESERVLRPHEPRDRGFAHLAWVDYKQRLGGPLWPIVLSVIFLVSRGAQLALRALDLGAG